MSDLLLSFTVPGEPVAKGRPKIGINPGTGRAQAFTPSKTRKAESDVKLFASNAMGGRALFADAMKVEVTAFRAKGMPGKPDARIGTKARSDWDNAIIGRLAPTTKPDADNYLKLALDACNGVVWKDDALIVDCTIRRRYSDRPRIEIRVWKWVPE